MQGSSFEYEWWTVTIRGEDGTWSWEFKGKNKESVIKQIKRFVDRTNSGKNDKPELGAWGRKARIYEVYWDTMKLDRKGYARRF